MTTDDTGALALAALNRRLAEARVGHTLGRPLAIGGRFGILGA